MNLVANPCQGENHHHQVLRSSQTQSIQVCVCSCHISIDSRHIICGSSSRPSYVSNVSSSNHSNSSSSSSNSSSLISSMSFSVVSPKSSDVSHVSHSISSSKNFFFDFDHEPCLVCLLCLCLRGRFRPP